MNPTDKGKISELIFLAALLRKGYVIATPFGNQGGWDLLVFYQGQWKTVQIKTARKRRRTYSVDPRPSMSRGGKRSYRHGECDFIGAVIQETSECWLIPIADCLTRSYCKLTDAHKL